MNNIKIPGREPVNRLAVWCLWECCICAKGERELTGIEKGAVFCAGDDVLVVVKAAAASEAMKFLLGVHLFGFRRIWCVT